FCLYLLFQLQFLLLLVLHTYSRKGEGLIILNPNYLKRISIWGRIVGIIIATYGLLIILIAFFTYYVLILSGLVSVWLGKLIFNIGLEAKRVLQSEENSIQIKDIEILFRRYKYFLFILSLLIVIAFLIHVGLYMYIDR